MTAAIFMTVWVVLRKGPVHLLSSRLFSLYVEPAGQHFCVITPGDTGGEGGGAGGLFGRGGSGGNGGGKSGGGGDGSAAHEACQPSDV